MLTTGNNQQATSNSRQEDNHKRRISYRSEQQVWLALGSDLPDIGVHPSLTYQQLCFSRNNNRYKGNRPQPEPQPEPQLQPSSAEDDNDDDDEEIVQLSGQRYTEILRKMNNKKEKMLKKKVMSGGPFGPGIATISDGMECGSGGIGGSGGSVSSCLSF
ncbi:GL21268 [Drosophila persimilis]|uniref:GL21268 n=1 Tax=Drosophila persimilis TaxID=7234 RepID=B4HAS3_DROPE|nr:GL21268 [Drosophila persimilis]